MKKRARRGNPQHLPEDLKNEQPTTKMIYLYLKGRGEVNYSTYSLGEALGSTPAMMSKGMRRLRELGLMEYEGKVRGDAKYTVVVLDRKELKARKSAIQETIFKNPSEMKENQELDSTNNQTSEKFGIN